MISYIVGHYIKSLVRRNHSKAMFLSSPYQIPLPLEFNVPPISNKDTQMKEEKGGIGSTRAHDRGGIIELIFI